MGKKIRARVNVMINPPEMPY